jgi:hypothetical protein
VEASFEGLREAVAMPWRAVSTPAFVAGGALWALLILVLATSDEGWVPILDSANLAFHEGGHPLFGLLGQTLALYGGTLMQLLVPLLAWGSAFLRREAVGAALTAAWLCQSLLNVARYMADARARSLPLVGGGEHDWWNILSRWGLLNYDTRLAGALRGCAWLGLLGCGAWLFWRWRYGTGSAAAGASYRPSTLRIPRDRSGQ